MSSSAKAWVDVPKEKRKWSLVPKMKM